MENKPEMWTSQRLSLWKKLHTYIGFALLIPITVLSVTGIILGLHESIYRTKFHYASKAQYPLVAKDLNRSVTLFKEAFPTLILASIALPKFTKNGPSATLRFKVTDLSGKNPRIFYLDSQTSEILRIEPSDQTDFLDWVLKIHRGTWGGFYGRLSMSSIGILFGLLWPTGLIIKKFRKGRKKDTLWTQRKLKSSIGLHRALSSLLGMGISFMGFSGAWINFNSELTQLLDPFPIQSAQNLSINQRASLQEQMETALAIRSHSTLESIYFSKAPAGTVLFYFSDNSRVYLQQHTGALVRTITPITHASQALFPIHSGRVLGDLQSLYMGFFGIGILMLSFSGVFYALKGSAFRLRKCNMNAAPKYHTTMIKIVRNSGGLK